jgi:FkbM family methyltransferase
MFYSQNNEDQIVAQYFQGKDTTNFTLLDIGANDGKTFSNSLHLIENGWNGVLFEPSPKAFALLQELHKDNEKVECLNYGLALFNGEKRFYESGGYKNGEDVCLYSSLDEEETKKWGDDVKFKEISADFITWSDFRATRKNQNYEFISIDAEGMDWIILNMIDLNEVNCQCLCVEYNSDLLLQAKMFKYVLSFGMKFHQKNAENLIFIR